MEAENFKDYSNPVILIKGGKVCDFCGGKSISLVGGASVMKCNPDLPEADLLRNWWYSGGGDDDFPE